MKRIRRYSPDEVRADFEKNAVSFAGSKDFAQLCSGLDGRNRWERTDNLRSLAFEGQGEKLAAAFRDNPQCQPAEEVQSACTEYSGARQEAGAGA